jgi:hypothetical protein
LTGCTSTAIKALTPDELQVLMLIEGAADTMVELELLRDHTILTVEIRRESTSNPKKARAGPGCRATNSITRCMLTYADVC